jgi:hypothetical protein
MILWFTNEPALTALIEAGKCVSVNEVDKDPKDLPGDAIDADIDSVKEHFEEDAWIQVLSKGDRQSYFKTTKAFC